MAAVEYTLPNVRALGKQRAYALAVATLERWQALAMQEHGTLGYTKDLVIEADGSGYAVRCAHPQVLEQEQGSAPYDMKASLGRGSHDRYSERYHRYYRIIPFRHGTRSYGRNSTLRHLTPMPRAVYDAVRQEGRLGEDTRYEAPRAAQSITGARATGMYTRLQRVASEGKRARYYTFRTMSQGSRADKWWHPGTEGWHLLPRLQQELKQLGSLQ